MQNKYEIIGIVGEGAYGIVMKCRNKETNEILAIKKFKDDEDEIVQKSMIRELKVLKKLRHDNIVQLKECFRRKGKLYLVFEYVDKNLYELLEETPTGLDPLIVKKIIYQLCKAVMYIHSNDMIHRDIKPENVLVTAEHNVKVCDFGFARSMPQKGGVLTDYVATRWYRAPELLLGSSNYGKEIDYWAIGCIMGEITDGKPMFEGDNELNQLYLIQKLLGPFPQAQLEVFYSNPRFNGHVLEPVHKPETLERRYFGKMNKHALSLMKGLLKLDPRERLTGKDVLMHSYFDEMRNEDPEFMNIRKKESMAPVFKPSETRTNKFVNTKNGFYDSSVVGNSKSPKREYIQQNTINSINQGGGVSSNRDNSLKDKPSFKIPKKFAMNYEKENVSSTAPKDNSNVVVNNNNIVVNIGYNTPLINPGINKTIYKTLYNKDDIYNFDIGIEDKKIRNNLITIEEEQQHNRDEELKLIKSKINLRQQVNDEDNDSIHLNKYTPKIKGTTKQTKTLKDDTSPDTRFPINAHFLPQIGNTYRNLDGEKDYKKIGKGLYY
jgi:cyclin-dependent kinase-like